MRASPGKRQRCGLAGKTRRNFMKSCDSDFDRITQMIQRMLDAEVIESESGAVLLAEARTGRELLELGDQQAARLHAERLAALIVALVGSGELNFLDGRAVIETLGGMLSSTSTLPHADKAKGESDALH